MKFLILGCNGMAGHIISVYLKEQGHAVTGIARGKSNYVETISMNVTDTKKLEEVIASGNYDVVVNCIGILNQFAEERKDQAVFLNGYLPHFLADITKESKTRIIHMSTDCVFSGEKGSYKEEDFADGKTFYDRSKAMGELKDEKNLTLRNSIVGPDINEKGIGLLNWFMKQTGEVSGFTKAIWTGQTTLQLAKTIEAAAKQNATGLINMVPSATINKYELLKLFNKYMRDDKLVVKEVEGICADKSLIRTNFEFSYEIPSYETMIKELAQWMKDHKDMYPHYEY